MVWESGERLVFPVSIKFDQALIVAVLPLGLVGIGVGWSRRRRALVFGALLPAAVFLVARWSDGALPPVLAGWSPAIVSALAAGWFWRPHR